MYWLAPIQRQEHRIVRIARFDLNYRSIREYMWANRSDHENARLRIENRAAGRQRVRRRPCWRGHNQAIGIELGKRFAVDTRTQQHQARKFATTQYGVVESKHFGRLFFAQPYPGLE